MVFLHSDIFAYLKNDLVPIERSDVDLLENYCLAFGVKPDEWQSDKDWNFNDEEERFDLRKVNTIRKQAVGPLLELRNRLCDASGRARTINAAEFTRVIFDFFNWLGVRGKISEWIEQAIEQKDYAAVEEHQQFYSRLIDVFDELAEVFGTEEMTCAGLFFDYQLCFFAIDASIYPAQPR